MCNTIFGPFLVGALVKRRVPCHGGPALPAASSICSGPNRAAGAGPAPPNPPPNPPRIALASFARLLGCQLPLVPCASHEAHLGYLLRSAHPAAVGIGLTAPAPMCPQNVKVSMGKKRRSPAQLAAVAGGREKAAANAAKRRAAAAEPFDDQVTGVVDQECPPGSPGAEFEAQLRELLEPDQLEPASRVLQVEVGINSPLSDIDINL